MIWKLKDMIKRGIITFHKGDSVIVFRRKSNGYPRSIKDNEEYIITGIEDSSLIVSKHSTDGIGFLPPKKVHKTYMIQKFMIRDLKINSILE